MQMDFGQPGSYFVGRRRVSVRRPNSATFNAQLYYPATARGDGTPIDASGAPYPAISFGHGFLQPPDRYRSTLEHLASWGYWVIATESALDLFPNHQQYSEDLRHCLTYLERENSTPSSSLYGLVAVNRFGVSGHSMGGGASILAGSADSRIRAIANLAAAETNPSAIQASSQVTVPHCLICGSADIITPVSSNGQRMYDAGFAPKLLPVIQGGWHCGFQDSSVFGCDSGPMPRAQQLEIARRLLTAFFELYLRNNLQAWDWVWGKAIRSDSNIALTADVGLSLSPEYLKRITRVPRVMEYRLVLKNLSRYTQSYRFLTTGNRWQTMVQPNPTPSMAPGGSVLARVLVAVPSRLRYGQDEVVVWAISERDGGSAVQARLLTILR